MSMLMMIWNGCECNAGMAMELVMCRYVLKRRVNGLIPTSISIGFGYYERACCCTSFIHFISYLSFPSAVAYTGRSRSSFMLVHFLQCLFFAGEGREHGPFSHLQVT